MNFDQLANTFKGKRVFLTGHTGFKGAWMLKMLHALGADVKGFSLAPENAGDLYNQLDGDSLCYSSVIGDIRDAAQIKGEIARYEPHFIFHLAAQSLVRRSYQNPADTFMVNAQGTAHVLEGLRALQQPCIALMITTDKVYENPERGEAFKEDDKLGGYDPYSASKAAAEIVIDSYRRSFFHPDNFEKHGKAVASVRAGNVIGGGDYAEDRIVPDIIRALDRGQKVTLRNPGSVRPWQHVLEPLAAYLQLAAKMTGAPRELSTAFNIGPEPEDFRTVQELTRIFLETYQMPDAYQIQAQEGAPHEARLLTLDSSKTKKSIGWVPRLDASTAIRWTAEWYADKRSATEKCKDQINAYFGNPS